MAAASAKADAWPQAFQRGIYSPAELTASLLHCSATPNQRVALRHHPRNFQREAMRAQSALKQRRLVSAIAPSLRLSQRPRHGAWCMVHGSLAFALIIPCFAGLHTPTPNTPVHPHTVRRYLHSPRSASAHDASISPHRPSQVAPAALPPALRAGRGTGPARRHSRTKNGRSPIDSELSVLLDVARAPPPSN